MFASCKAKWEFERQYVDEKRGATTGKRGVPDGECCEEKKST